MAGSYALIGVGGIGGYHLASVQKLASRGLARPAAVVEPAVEKFAELKSQLEAQGVRWYRDYREMLRTEDGLQAVTIATPIHLHCQMTRACLERGLYVNLEKPPVPLVQQLTALIELDAQRRVTVGFQMILSRCVQRMKQLIIEGAIGEVRHIRAAGCWPRGERYYQRARWAGKLVLDDEPVFDGPATNALAHLVHNVMFLAGGEMDGFAVPAEVRGELYRARPIESYDVACMRGSFPSGAEFSLAVTHSTRELMPFAIEARGSRGWLRLSNDGSRLEGSSGELIQARETTQELLDTCYEHFNGVVHHPERRTYTSLEDTTGYVRTTNAVFLSSGGVHDIPQEWIDGYSSGDGPGCDVRGLSAMVERTLNEGRLFSEMGVEWASARPASVRLDGFHALDLRAVSLQPAV